MLVGRLDPPVVVVHRQPDFTTLSALDAHLDAVRTALEVDLIGPWGMILAMLPLLKEAPAARIVNVSSTSAQQIATGLDHGAPLRAPAYSIAEYMLNVLITTPARALEDTPILVNAVDPGETATHAERGRRRQRTPRRRKMQQPYGSRPAVRQLLLWDDDGLAVTAPPRRI